MNRFFFGENGDFLHSRLQVCTLFMAFWSFGHKSKGSGQLEGPSQLLFQGREARGRYKGDVIVVFGFLLDVG